MSVRVLVVDDERNLVNLLRGYLEREVYEALDGVTALEVARRIGPELVVLDWMLPGIGGTRVLSELRRFSEAYVITLTPAGARSAGGDRATF